MPSIAAYVLAQNGKEHCSRDTRSQPGPLDEYRKRASFELDEMVHYMLGDSVTYMKHVWETLEKDDLFKQNTDNMLLDEHRRLTHRRIQRFNEYDFITSIGSDHPRLAEYCARAVDVLDRNATAKMMISYVMFGDVLLSMSLHPHIQSLGLEAREFKFTGCFALTELSHGSNTKGMGTTATYDAASEEFVLHTPSFGATKCWIGNLGCTASYGVVFAQLYTPDGVCHGLHNFLVPIRDRKTHLPFKGIIVGDMGRKIGLNGKDNGYMLFEHYRIPRDHLLNRTADVTKDGRYVTPFKDKSKRFGAQLGVLSGGRVNISAGSASTLAIVVTIALRYSVARRQFGPPGKDEWPVIEYQLQYWRLMPYVAAVYMWKMFAEGFRLDYNRFTERLMEGDSSDDMADLGREIHGISCAGKPYGTWMARDGIQECREACGGHGYLSVNQIGQWRNNHDSTCTYEGENNVLLQQTGNYLLSLELDILSTGEVASPLGSLEVFNDIHNVLTTKCTALSVADVITPEVILHSYKWLVCYLYMETLQKIKEQTKLGKTAFEVKNETQAYLSRSLSLAYIKHFALVRNMRSLETDSMSASLRAVLRRMLSLFGLWALQPHIATLAEGGYFSDGNQIRFIKDAILDLSLQLKDDSVALMDAFSLPDSVIKAPIGFGGGDALKHLFDAMVTENPTSRERVSWWEEIVNPPEVGSKSHLVSRL